MNDVIALEVLWKFTSMQPSSKRKPPDSHMLSFLPDQDLGLPLEPRLLRPGQGHLHPGGQHRGLPRRRRPRPARDPRVEVIPLGDGAPDLRQERDEVPR